ncbi:hypothetical protein [Pseudomonas putida]|uniref:Uncharacterized protein n=1 Tax=Pseudomonas putida TaxID=303 RepID=A0A1Q9R2A4_PSEPU|nr:hypothetical protein [Pseudomonas putida]OLS61495.1 hypothetical protein PSEMO_35620 [Pseudomonas putida]
MEGLEGVLTEGEPLLERAMQAVRRFHEARDSSTPREEVERLKDEAEALMKELSVLQMDALERIIPKA